MARARRIREVSDQVAATTNAINQALDQGITFPYDGKENSMNNDEVVVPAATENVVEPAPAAAENVDPTAAPPAQSSDGVEVVRQVDSTEAVQHANAVREAEDDANLSDIETLRRFSADELRERGVPASSIPRNAANTKPDLDPEKARELEQRAKASPTNSFTEGGGEGEAPAEGEAAGGEAVG